MIFEQLGNRINLTKTEQQISEFIQKNPRIVVNTSLAELSQECFASQASVIRLCKKMGTKGFADFKIKLASELSSLTVSEEKILEDIPILKSDKCENIMKTFYNLSHRAIEAAYNNIAVKDIEDAAKLLIRADAIKIYGRGEALIVAEDFHYKLLRMGINSSLEALNGFQEVTNGDVNKKINTIALVISQYCNSRQVRYVLSELISCNIPFIIVTAAKNVWPYNKFAKLIIRISSLESRRKIGSFAARTEMLYVLDCVYGQIFVSDYEKNMKRLIAYSNRKLERKYYYEDIIPK